MIHTSIANLLSIDPKARTKSSTSPSRKGSSGTSNKAQEAIKASEPKTFSRQFLEHFSHPKF